MRKYASPEEDVWPKRGSSHSSTSDGWKVEARLAYHTPTQVAGMLLDLRWRQVHFDKSPVGVPGERYPNFLVMAGLLTYQQAQALRWWFIAEAQHQSSSLCLETRLIKCRLKASYEYEEVSSHAVIGGDDRSSIMPDYGVKEDGK